MVFKLFKEIKWKIESLEDELNTLHFCDFFLLVLIAPSIHIMFQHTMVLHFICFFGQLSFSLQLLFYMHISVHWYKVIDKDYLLPCRRVLLCILIAKVNTRSWCVCICRQCSTSQQHRFRNQWLWKCKTQKETVLFYNVWNKNVFVLWKFHH